MKLEIISEEKDWKKSVDRAAIWKSFVTSDSIVHSIYVSMDELLNFKTKEEARSYVDKVYEEEKTKLLNNIEEK